MCLTGVHVQGTNDTVVPYHYAPRVEALFGQAQTTLVMLKGAQHDLTISHSKEIVGHLGAFFGKGKGGD